MTPGELKKTDKNHKNMKAYAKIRVVFSSDTLLDFDELVKDLETEYRIGYAGLFVTSTTQTCLALQTLPKMTSFSIGKVAKICGKFVEKFEIVPGVDNNLFGYQVLEERGRFRSRGGKRPAKNNIIYLYINALGEEDISHVTPEKLEKLVGSEDDVVDFFDRNYNIHAKNAMCLEEWAQFRRYSRQKVRKWDRQEQLRGSFCRELRVNETASDSESDFDQEISVCPIYDPDSDSEGNVQRKRLLLRNRFIERAPGLKKDDFLKNLEILLLENPHNSNVIASTKEGYFKYFDGSRWVKAYNKDFFDKVTLGRISKAGEILNSLTLSDFMKDQVSSMVTELMNSRNGSEVDLFLGDNTEAVKDGILAAENQDVRIDLVESTRQKSVVRVGRVDKVDNLKVVRNTTWEKLLRANY